MKKQSAEDYLDKLLNSVNGETYTEDEMDVFGDVAKEIMPVVEHKPEMVTRRISKSEEDFLREFEAELEGDDFDDFLKNFDKDTMNLEDVDVAFDGNDFLFDDTKREEPMELSDLVDHSFDEESFDEETPASADVDEFPLEALLGSTSEESLPMDLFVEDTSVSEENPVEDSFDLGGVDLGALLNEATAESPIPDTSSDSDSDDDLLAMLGGAVTSVAESDVSNEAPVDDMFVNLFGEDSVGEVGDLASLDNLFSTDEGASSGLDLGNLGEADLMSLLSGNGELSDLGDMLSQSDSSEMSMDGLDAFAAFAEGEMAAQGEAPAEEAAKKPKKKGGKGGLLDKIKDILFSDDEDDEVELKASSVPSAGQLSGENAEILAEMDAEEKSGKGKGGFLGKFKKGKNADDKKDKKEKKEKKPKKEKPKKASKPKKEKPKKEKKPKEVDNTPPLPKGPVFMIWLMVFSLIGLVYLGTNLIGYSSCVADAKTYYNTGNYAEAYQELLGLTIKEKDMALYNQVATLATVDSELNAYKVFLENERQAEALDSLVCAAGRCELNEDSAEVYECIGQMEILRKEVTNQLNNYGMTYEQALEMYHIKDREDYTIALYTKLKELGLE